MESKRNDANELTYKTETDSQTWRMNLYSVWGGMREKDNWGVRMDMDTLLYVKWITNKISCIAHGALLHVGGGQDGRGLWGRMDTCIFMADSLGCSPETITPLIIGYTSIQNRSFLF